MSLLIPCDQYYMDTNVSWRYPKEQKYKLIFFMNIDGKNLQYNSKPNPATQKNGCIMNFTPGDPGWFHTQKSTNF
jgi:hypothetical protein